MFSGVVSIFVGGFFQYTNSLKSLLLNWLESFLPSILECSSDSIKPKKQNDLPKEQTKIAHWIFWDGPPASRHFLTFSFHSRNGQDPVYDP